MIILVLRALTHDIPITVCLPFVNPRLTIKRVRRGPKLTKYPDSPGRYHYLRPTTQRVRLEETLQTLCTLVDTHPLVGQIQPGLLQPHLCRRRHSLMLSTSHINRPILNVLPPLTGLAHSDNLVSNKSSLVDLIDHPHLLIYDLHHLYRICPRIPGVHPYVDRQAGLVFDILQMQVSTKLREHQPGRRTRDTLDTLQKELVRTVILESHDLRIIFTTRVKMMIAPTR